MDHRGAGVIELELAEGQRFDCRRCGRCCRGIDVVLTPGEVADYRRAGAERWFRERADGPDGSVGEPFLPLAGRDGYRRIRRRPDGTCGFLAPDGLCQLHRELGASRKPLACRLFPFRLLPVSGQVVVRASFSCPTVVANDGAPVAARRRELGELWTAWSRAYPQPPVATTLLAGGPPLAAATVARLRSVLGRLMTRPDRDGRPDPVGNLRRVAALVDDLTRWRVLRLDADAFSDYLEVMGRHALDGTAPPPGPRPVRLGRLRFRGFLLAALVTHLRVDGRDRGGRRLYLTSAALLLHLHGLGPAVRGFDLGRARRVLLPRDDPEVKELVGRYLGAAVDTLGDGLRPLVDDLALSVATLNAALMVAAMAAAGRGERRLDAAGLAAGLVKASDLGHADGPGRLGRLLTGLAAGPDALHLFPVLPLEPAAGEARPSA